MISKVENKVNPPGALSIWSKENTLFLLLFLVMIGVVYFMPFIINQMVFILLLIMMARSRKDYFWLAFFFLLEDAPGRLFQGGLRSDLQRIAFYPLFSGVTLTFEELFIAVFLIKAITARRKYSFHFKRNFDFLTVYTVLLLAYSFLIGMDLQNFVLTIRFILPWLLVFIIPKVFLDGSDFDRTIQLLFPVCFIALASQFYAMFTGNYIGFQLKGQTFETSFLLVTEGAKEAIRAGESSSILFLCFGMALFYLFSKKQLFSRTYLMIIASICFVSVFLSATRGWIMAYIAFLFMMLITYRAAINRKIVKFAVTASVFLLIVLGVFPVIKVQIRNSFNRLNTISALAQGDATAENTLSRITVRVPAVMKKFHQNPIFGWGFSDEYYKTADHHVGQANVLLNAGVIGYFLLNGIFLIWCMKIHRLSRIPEIRETYGAHTVNILAFILIGLYVIHSTSSQSWGYDIGINKIIIYAFILTYVSRIAGDSKAGAVEPKKVPSGLL